MEHRLRKQRLVVLAILGAALPTSAAAQIDGPPKGGPYDPSGPEARRVQATVVKAYESVHKAQARLRERKLREAEGLARTAILLCEGVSQPCMEGHDVVAESALLQNDPNRALGELQDGTLSYRGRMTKALALLALDRPKEALPLLVALAGTFESRQNEAGLYGFWDLPMDRGQSKASLAATAYLLRASHEEDPETIADLRAAEKLAPSNAAVRLMLAFDLQLHDKLEEARVYAAKAAAMGDALTRRKGATYVEMIDRMIKERAERSGG